jgi:hypothetical protein
MKGCEMKYVRRARLGWLLVMMFWLRGPVWAQTALLAENPVLAIGSTDSGVGGRFELFETVPGNVFGPGKVGNIVIRFANYGVIDSIGYNPTGCFGTGSVALLADGFRFTITAAPATAPTETCGIAVNLTLRSVGASPGPITATVDGASTLAGLSVGASTSFGSWGAGWGSLALAGLAVPASGIAGSVIALPDMDINEFAVGAIYANAGNPISLTLPAGYAWTDAGTVTVRNATMGANPPTIDPADARRLLLDWVDPSNLPAHDNSVLRLSGQRIQAPAAALGPVLVVASVPITGEAPIVGSGTQVATIGAAPAASSTVGIPALGGLELGALSVLLAGLGGWARGAMRADG